MAISNLVTCQREAARIGSSLPEIARHADSARELQARAERARLAVIEETATILRACDWLIETIQELPPEAAPESANLVAMVKEHRRQAFEKMGEVNPDQLWFWTEEGQAGERAVDRDIAAGVPEEGPMTGEEFLAALDAVIACRDCR